MGTDQSPLNKELSFKKILYSSPPPKNGGISTLSSFSCLESKSSALDKLTENIYSIKVV